MLLNFFARQQSENKSLGATINVERENRINNIRKNLKKRTERQTARANPLKLFTP